MPDPSVTTQPLGTHFKFTSDDKDILLQYLDEFKLAETNTRTRIIERAMADIYQLRPPNAPFDKKAISQV